jgi:serine/threonine protein kinase
VVESGNRPQSADVDDVVNAAQPGTPDVGGTLPAESVLDRRYRLIGVLSSRGPVTLWRGDDTVLTRPVAVRVVEHTDRDPARQQAAQSLLTAAVNSGRLVHPGAASTYDATVTETEYGQVSYVITEWVDGRALRNLVETGPLRADQAAAVVLGAARVIAAAHERGLHHGDLRPGDVIVSSHGTVKVLDLEVGAVLARLDGSAPEYETQQAAEAADVRALGGLLYAALTGCWPLGGDSGLPTAPYGTYGRLQSPRQLNHAVPRDLDGIAMAAVIGEEAGTAPITTASELIAELEAVTPVEALHDTGLMAFGDQPARTEAMTGGYGSDTSGLPSTSGYVTPDQYGYGEYDDGYAYQDDYADTGYEQGYDGYPPAQRGYAPGGAGPRVGGRAAARQQRGGRRPLVIGIILAVVLVIVIASVVAIRLGGGGGSGNPAASSSSSASATPGAAFTPSAVTAFDPPPGDGTENDAMLPNLTDGKANTQWTTSGYNVVGPGIQFGGLKKGVGFKVAFSQPIHPSQIVITVGTIAPITFELHAAATDGQTIDAFPIVGSAHSGDAGQQITIRIPSNMQPAQYWVVWLTTLAPDPTDATKLKGSIAEIKFLS